VDADGPAFPDEFVPIYGSDIWARMTPRERTKLKRDNTVWTLSQFLHGEQGALLATSQLVAAAPDYAAKLFGATQVVDEARHVEVYARYLRDKLEDSFPVSVALKSLLDQVVSDSRWDMKYLGMQIMVEGLAIAAFRVINMMTTEPLIRALTTAVLRDEARHVAFGVVALKDCYVTMAGAELREREDFVIEASRLMRERLLAHDLWLRNDLPLDACIEFAARAPLMTGFRATLFGTIVPNLRRLGLLTPRVRAALDELGVFDLGAALLFRNHGTARVVG
jgi:hypothetical protein